MDSSAEAPARAGHRRRFGLASPLTRKILAVNVIAPVVLLAGFLFLNRYETGLIDAEIEALRTQGEIFAGALGHGAYETRRDGASVLRPEIAGPMLRRLVIPTATRARLFNADGELIADSRRLLGPAGAVVQVVPLAPPGSEDAIGEIVVGLYDKVRDLLPGRRKLNLYTERADQRAVDYAEVTSALVGDAASLLRIDENHDLVIGVAVPVQRFKLIIGAIFLTADGARIDEAVRSVRLDILKVFAGALMVTILLSLYLGGVIIRPLRRLALAAARVRDAPGRSGAILEFPERDDEIGDLATDLRAMTEALSMRLDAIDSFAADVAHEIKNPLTSLRSAVETAARLTDPQQQQKLMEIILDDVQRLDRLITDISDASRLDAELSRDERDPLDLDKLLATLVEIHSVTGAGADKHLVFDAGSAGPFRVRANEGRVVQVFQNLLSNALSFSPAPGHVKIAIRREGIWIVATVDDEGPGIPKGGLARIFERFYSERPEGERFGMHSGLGLSISRQIVESHGGTIRVENRVKEGGVISGARFTVRLPAL
jgi:two-component system sensor histidine kinase ChvG